jgi:hypothetical protein
MTTDKDFKRLVRQRASKTGESYSAARRRLLESKGDNEMVTSDLRRVEKPDDGFVLHVPADCAEAPADKLNNPYELARWGSLTNDGVRRLYLVMRRPGSTGLDPRVAAEATQRNLERSFKHFVLAETTVDGRPAARLDFQMGNPSSYWGFGVWRAREYFVPVGNLVWTLGLGSSREEPDAALFEAMANGFHLL